MIWQQLFEVLVLTAIILNLIACSSTPSNTGSQTQIQLNKVNGDININSNENKSEINQVLDKVTREDDPCGAGVMGLPKKPKDNFQIKISTTGKIILENSARISFNLWFSIFANAGLEAFSEGKLKDEAAIRFALWRLFPVDKPCIYGNEHHEQTDRCKDITEFIYRIDEKEIQPVITKYFQMEIKNTESFKDSCTTHDQGCYSYKCYASGDMGFVFAVAGKIKSLGNNEFQTDVTIFDAIIFSESSNPADCKGGNNEKKTKEIEGLDIIGDYETLMSECPKWKTKMIKKSRAKFRLIKDENDIRPVLLSYQTIHSCGMCHV